MDYTMITDFLVNLIKYRCTNFQRFKREIRIYHEPRIKIIHRINV